MESMKKRSVKQKQRVSFQGDEEMISKACFVVAAVIIITGLILSIAGCQPQAEVIPDKVWGQGDLPDDWQEFFGNENMARLNFVQTQSINNQGKAIAELAERVRKLEADPNEAATK